MTYAHLLLKMAATANRNAVFIWGFGKYGQLGNGESESKGLPQRIRFDKDAKPTIISCGGHHTLVALEGDTRPLSCGRGLYGRLGNGKENDKNSFAFMSEPVKDADNPTSKENSPLTLGGGHWHSAYVSIGGDIFIWGYNKAHNVLGIEGLPPFVSIPTHIPTKICFINVSCGFNYTLAVSREHIAYSWGCGRNGVLSQGDTEDRATPTPIAELEVESVNAGYCHASFVTTSRQLYTCGKGSDGALGHGVDKRDKLTATLVGSLSSERVRSVSCSQGEHHSHTLAATETGVFSWGDGYKGKLGLGDETSKDFPTRIPSQYFEDCLVSRVSAGGIHSAAVATDTGVFVWGCGSDGRLGLPEAIGHRYLFRSNIPRKVDLGKWKPFDVSCSYYHTAVICRQGDQ